MNIRDRIFELQDLKYKEFHSKLCPNVSNIIGVRVPVLRQFAKELYKEDNEVINKIGNKYYEEIMLQGFLIAFSNENVETKINYIRNFLPKIDNWAVCDVFCSSLKIKHQEKLQMMKK